MEEKIKGFTLVELIAVVAILGLIALVVYPAIASVIRNSRESAYNDQVKVIEKAATEWSIDNANSLKDDGTVNNVSVDTLVSEGYISNDEVKDPRDSSKNLTGHVEIVYDSSIKQFTYTYVDNQAKSNEVSMSLASTITNSSKKKDVLLANNGIYKGDNPDNYIKIGGKLWRIINNNDDGSIRAISEGSSAKISWDIEGETDFDNSTIKTYLNNTFYTSLNDVSNFKQADFCVDYDNNKCLKKESVTVGLLTTMDYLNASNNLKCVTGMEADCTKGNYLADFSESNGPEYTLSKNGDKIYVIENGILSVKESDETLNVRPVLTINENAKIVGGNGSKDNPYLLSEV